MQSVVSVETLTYWKWKVFLKIIKLKSDKNIQLRKAVMVKEESCSADDTFADNQKLLQLWLWPLTNTKKRLAGRGKCRYVENTIWYINANNLLVTSDYWRFIDW